MPVHGASKCAYMCRGLLAHRRAVLAGCIACCCGVFSLCQFGGISVGARCSCPRQLFPSPSVYTGSAQPALALVRLRGLQAGIPTAISSDNVRDQFYAYGDLDMLEVFTQARTSSSAVPCRAFTAWRSGRDALARRFVAERSVSLVDVPATYAPPAVPAELPHGAP